MVVDSGVLKGLSEDDIRRAGEHLIFQSGCKNFFQEIMRSENLLAGVHVLSYCWSGDLIRSAFSSGNGYVNLSFLELHYILVQLSLPMLY